MSARIVFSVSAARQGFTSLISQAKEHPVEITRHGRLEAVLISPQLFQRMKDLGIVRDDALTELQRQFSALVSDMQSACSFPAYDMLEALSARDLPTAVAAARRRTTATSTNFDARAD